MCAIYIALIKLFLELINKLSSGTGQTLKNFR